MSNFTDVNRGCTVGFRISASSLLISASMSPPASDSSSSAVPLTACSPYSLVAYYEEVSCAHLEHGYLGLTTHRRSTYSLKQISQVGNSWCFFLHGAGCPDAHITRIDRPCFRSFASPWHLPLLLALRAHISIMHNDNGAYGVNILEQDPVNQWHRECFQLKTHL